MRIISQCPIYFWGLLALLIFISNVFGVPQSPVGTAKSSQKAFDFVTKAEAEFKEASIKASHIEWAYATNITDANEKKKLEYQVSFVCLFVSTPTMKEGK